MVVMEWNKVYHVVFLRLFRPNVGKGHSKEDVGEPNDCSSSSSSSIITSMLIGESNMGLENSEFGNAVGTNEVVMHGSVERLKSFDVRELMLNTLVNETDIRRVMDSRRFKDGTCTEDMTVVVLEKRVVVL